MKERIIGSWKARRDGRINANSFAECSDILTLERDGKVFRQFDTTKVVDRQDGGKEKYQVIITKHTSLFISFQRMCNMIFFKQNTRFFVYLCTFYAEKALHLYFDKATATRPSTIKNIPTARANEVFSFKKTIPRNAPIGKLI